LQNDDIVPCWAVAVVLSAGCLFWVGVGAFLASRYKRATPGKALVVWGKRSFSFAVVGGRFVYPVIEHYARLPLDGLHVDLHLVSVRTADGADMTIEAEARVKIEPSEGMLGAAAEHLLGKTKDEIAVLAGAVIERGCRQAVRYLSAAEASDDEAAVATKAGELSEPELTAVGLVVVGTTVRSVSVA